MKVLSEEEIIDFTDNLKERFDEHEIVAILSAIEDGIINRTDDDFEIKRVDEYYFMEDTYAELYNITDSIYVGYEYIVAEDYQDAFKCAVNLIVDDCENNNELNTIIHEEDIDIRDYITQESLENWYSSILTAEADKLYNAPDEDDNFENALIAYLFDKDVLTEWDFEFDDDDGWIYKKCKDDYKSLVEDYVDFNMLNLSGLQYEIKENVSEEDIIDNPDDFEIDYYNLANDLVKWNEPEYYLSVDNDYHTFEMEGNTYYTFLVFKQ